MSNSITTTVIGSYCVPDWYPTLQQAVVEGRLTKRDFYDAKAIAVRAAIKDQESAGIDVVSDGELFRRDDNCYGPPNAMINYFAAKIPGFAPDLKLKSGISPVAPDASLPAPVIRSKLQPTTLGLLDELKFMRATTGKKVKIAMTGPHMFARVCFDEFYDNPKKVAMEMAAIINAEFLALDEGGCDVIQLDEPILWFLAQDQQWGITAINQCFEGVKRAKKALHLCQGNYNPDPSKHQGLRIFPAEFAAAMPIVQQANVDVVMMAFASLGVDDLSCLQDFPKDKILGVGAVDVQTHDVESPDKVARNIERIAQYVDLDRLWVNPDCGLNHLSRDVAFGKLQSMCRAAARLI